MSKRIILVHGRGKKPAQDEKERLVRSALLHGLGRVSPEAREAVASGGVHLELVYFGDVNNKLIWADETEREVGRDFHSWVVEPLPAAPFDEGLERLFRHETSEQCLDGYRRLRGEFPIRHWLDEAARLVSPVLDALGLSERAVQWWPEIEHYGRSNLVAKNVQGRVRAALERALARDDRVCLVTHSLGT
jgi:hypothetical protein